MPTDEDNKDFLVCDDLSAGADIKINSLKTRYKSLGALHAAIELCVNIMAECQAFLESFGIVEKKEG